jgi:hypothetical protein
VDGNWVVLSIIKSPVLTFINGGDAKVLAEPKGVVANLILVLPIPKFDPGPPGYVRILTGSKPLIVFDFNSKSLLELEFLIVL